MHTDIQKSIQKLLDKYPQHKEEKALYDALKELLDKTSKEDENLLCKAENIGGIVVENIPALIGQSANKHIIPSGFNEFDHKFGSFTKGEYVIIGGRPSMGKSQFVVNLCLNMLPAHPIAYFSLDLNKTHLLARLLAAKTTIAANSILQKQLSLEEITTLEKAAVEISTSTLYISDLPVYDLQAFEVECRCLVKEHKVQVIAVDYIQLIGKPSATYYSSRDRELATISRCIKNLAKELNVLFLCVSQLSRSVETRGGDKKPQLSDLRDSGSLEQDADKVILLYRPEYYSLLEDCDGTSSKGKMEVIMAKNKHGRSGSIQLNRTPEFTSFTEIESLAPDSKLEIKPDRMKDFDIF